MIRSWQSGRMPVLPEHADELLTVFNQGRTVMSITIEADASIWITAFIVTGIVLVSLLIGKYTR